MKENNMSKDIKLRDRALYSPIRVYVKENGYCGLPDISIMYRYESIDVCCDKEGRYSPSICELFRRICGYNIRTMKQSDKIGLEGVCFGVDEFSESSSETNYVHNKFGTMGEDYFYPDIVLTGMTQDEVIEKYTKIVHDEREKNIEFDRKRGVLVGEIFEEKEDE